VKIFIKSLIFALALFACCQPRLSHAMQVSKHESDEKVFNELYATIDSDLLGEDVKELKVKKILETLDLSKVIAKEHASGQTLLHAAAEWGYRDILVLLVANGADLNKKNNKDGDKTALDYAKENPYDSAYKFLNDATTFFSGDQETFSAFIKERLGKESLKTMLTFSATRDEKFAYRFYKTICEICDKEKRKALGCAYDEVKFFYLDIAKAASKPLKIKWFLRCCELCNDDVFRPNGWTGEFEDAVKKALKTLVDNKNNKTYYAIQKLYDEQILPGRNRLKKSPKKDFTDLKIGFKK
jgi:hypothetical protein